MCPQVVGDVLLEDAIPSGGLTSPQTSLIFPAQTLMSEIEGQLAENILQRVAIYQLERQLYSLDNVPLPDFPVVEGREELLPRLYEFFRMTDAQKARRDKYVRDKERLKRRQEKEKLRKERLARLAEQEAQQVRALSLSLSLSLSL